MHNSDQTPKSIAFMCSSEPAPFSNSTFTFELIKNIKHICPSTFRPFLIVVDPPSAQEENSLNQYHVHKQVISEYLSAADLINQNGIQSVCLQHSFDLYGGPSGLHVCHFLERLAKPVISILQTVPPSPSSMELTALKTICEQSRNVVALSHQAMDLLVHRYGADPCKVKYIPPGVPKLAFEDSEHFKAKLSVNGRKVLLTVGPIHRQSGLETVFRAMQEIVRHDPSIVYIVIGDLPAKQKQQEGDAYLLELEKLIKQLGIEKNILLWNHTLSQWDFIWTMNAADIYISPSLYQEDVPGGALSLAIATGKVLFSTPDRATHEHVSNGQPILTAFDSPETLAEAVINLFQNDKCFTKARKKTYAYAKTLMWSHVAKRYWQLFEINDTFDSEIEPKSLRRKIHSSRRPCEIQTQSS